MFEKLNRDIEDIFLKKTQTLRVENNNDSDQKNMPDGINSRLDVAEEKAGELEDTVREFIQKENGTNHFY